MRLRVNGQETDAAAATLGELLGPLPHGSAVAVNGHVVPRAGVSGHPIVDGDDVEVVTAVAGG
ncbi:sulfur carrier protein ThiS [Nocardioides seonyuensis]|uniref:Sulfur carrier protein ThiS n=1 Tax=Nocardioides seonyuensis TaxID=2518371 RepID=A0A4P7IBT1_9ACTN|nr:sulfur carrier protein ThiS [Nocardioides seonyuensis]QBX54535.1 sulfur carrier protein ThiS [Nocardioides seonyuensis]